MNILFYYSITANPRHGGIANVTIHLCKAFENRGHNIYILSSTKTQEDVVPYQYYLPDGVNFTCEQNRVFFLEFLKSYQIDVCVSQNGTAPDHNEGIAWCNIAGVPIVTVVHSSLSGTYGANRRLRHLHPLMKKIHIYNLFDGLCQLIFKRKYYGWYQFQGKNSDAIVLLSDKFKDEYYYYTGVKGNKVFAIPNVLTLDNIPDNVPDEKKKHLLFVGRISHEKQVDKLLEIWERLYKLFPDWDLKIVGDISHGSCKIFKNLKKKAESMGLTRYSFEGFKNPDVYYRDASIFCMTSSFEGFGLVLIEAMAYGTIPIAFNSYASASEIIDDNVNGFLVSPFSIEEYAEKLTNLMSIEDLRNRMSIKAKEKSKKYLPDNIACKWEELFIKIIKQKKTRII